MQVDPLRQSLALHAQPRCAGGIQPELSLLDGAQVDTANPVLDLREFDCASIVSDGCVQQGIPAHVPPKADVSRENLRETLDTLRKLASGR